MSETKADALLFKGAGGLGLQYCHLRNDCVRTHRIQARAVEDCGVCGSQGAFCYGGCPDYPKVRC